MLRRDQRIERTTRQAATAVGACVIAIVGSAGLFLQALRRTQPAGAERVAFYTAIPDIDLRSVDRARLPDLLRQLNTRRCPCGCMRTVAGCRNHHRSCPDSIAAALDLVHRNIK